MEEFPAIINLPTTNQNSVLNDQYVNNGVAFAPNFFINDSNTN
jgi:hypothetical protein